MVETGRGGSEREWRHWLPWRRGVRDNSPSGDLMVVEFEVLVRAQCHFRAGCGVCGWVEGEIAMVRDADDRLRAFVSDKLNFIFYF